MQAAPIQRPRGRPPYFWWLLANALAFCFAVLSWAGCLHVFGNPEIPRNYELLRRIGRLPEPHRFTVLDAPQAHSLRPPELYEKFFGVAAGDLQRLNALLMRNYMTNFTRPLLLSYVEGDFEIEAVRELQEGDFIPRGVVVRARAMVKPDEFSPPSPYPVRVEYLFPTEEPGVAGFFEEGDLLAISKSPNCAVVLHIERVLDEEGDPLLCVTVVPIAYGPYQAGEDTETFGIEPPVLLNPGAGFPLFRDDA